MKRGSRGKGKTGGNGLQVFSHDINLLEFPIWFQDERRADDEEKKYRYSIDIQTSKGPGTFTFIAGYKTPVQRDKIFLNHLLYLSESQGWNEAIEISRYDLLARCGLTDCRDNYDRLEDSLDRWKLTALKFKQCFYNSDNYVSVTLGVVSSWSINTETGKLVVRFDQEWIKAMRLSKYQREISLIEMKALESSSLDQRLCELLIKSFYDKDRWDINCMDLAKLIPLNVKYPSDAVKQLKKSVRNISDRTRLKVELEVEKIKRGTTKLIFRRVTSPDPQDGETTKSKFSLLMDLVPENVRGEIKVQQLVAANLGKDDKNYEWMRNALNYVQARKGVRAYVSYLKWTIENSSMVDGKFIVRPAEKPKVEEQLMADAMAFLDKGPEAYESIKKKALERMGAWLVKGLEEGEDQAVAELIKIMCQIVIEQGLVK